MRTRYFSDEELEKYHKEGRIHDDKVEYTDVHEIYYTAILTTPDGRHYRVRYYQYKNYPDDRYFYDECEELFLVPKLTLEMGYSSTPRTGNPHLKRYCDGRQRGTARDARKHGRRTPIAGLGTLEVSILRK